MRTADQVRRKYNEFAARKQALQERLEAGASEGDAAALEAQVRSLDEQMLLLEWVLNAPLGSYHG